MLTRRRTLCSVALVGVFLGSVAPARAEAPPQDIADIQAKLANRERLTDDEQRRLFIWTTRKSNQTDRDLGQTPTDDQNGAMPKDIQDILARARASGSMSAADQARIKAWGASTQQNKQGLEKDARDTIQLLKDAPPPTGAPQRREPPTPSDNTITVEIKQRTTSPSGDIETTGTITFPVTITADDNPNENAFHLKFMPNPLGSARGSLRSAGWGLSHDGKDAAGNSCPEHKDTFDTGVAVNGSGQDPRVRFSGEVVVPAGRRPYTNATLLLALTGQGQTTCGCNSANNTQSTQAVALSPITLDGLRSDVPFSSAVGDLPVLAAGQGVVERSSPDLKEVLDQAFFNFDTAGARRALDEGGDFATSSTYHYKMVKGDAVSSSTVTFRFKLKFPKRVCGPDITDALKRTVAKLEANFNAQSSAVKVAVCLESISPTSAVTWDILGIRDRHQWIERTRPTCDVGGPNPTVDVGGQCFYTGSVNYLLWGVMFRLCAQANPNAASLAFSEDRMIEYISIYKGGVPGVTNQSGNFGPSQWWSRAGYEGWPAAPTPPGDRPKQKCTCPKDLGQDFPTNDGSTFLVGWAPGFNTELNAPRPPAP